MAGEGRTPSTRNARVTEPDGKHLPTGTGQHMPGTTATRGPEYSRANDSPSKSASYPRTNSGRDGKSGTSQSQTTANSQRTTTAPAPQMPTYQMLKDSGAKSERERTFTRINAEIRSKLDGVGKQDIYPSGYEAGTLGQIAKGDKFAGTKPTIRPKRAQ